MNVSIIIPVYNVEKYLEQCIESAVNQTLDNIEIIAINDGSTDNSLQILEEYSEKYKFFKVINQKNRGLSATRNRGLKEARGKYIYFLDSDDYIDKNTLSICFEKAEKYNLDIVTFDADIFIESKMDKINVHGDYDREKRLESIVIDKNQFYNYAIKNRGFRVPVWLNFYRTEFLNEKEIEFVEGIIHEDELHSLQSFVLAEKVMYLPKKLFYRRIREASIITSKITLKNVEGIFTVAEEAYNFYIKNKNNFDDKTNINILNRIRKFYKYAINYCDKLDIDKNEITKIRKNIIDSINEKDIILNFDLNMMITNPKMYYRIERIKLYFKEVLKKIY